MIAVGAKHALGSKHSAYVPAPSDALTAKMFRDPSDPAGDGVGLSKLQFYSPQNFRLFTKSLQMTKIRASAPFGYYRCDTMPDPPGEAG